MKLLPTSPLILLVVVGFPSAAALVGWWSVEDPALRTWGLSATLAVALVAGLVVGRLFARLRHAGRLAERLVAGGLAIDRRRTPRSGDLLTVLGALEGRLRGVRSHLGRSSAEVARLHDSLSTAARQISAAAANQADATESGHSLVERMGVSIEVVGGSAQAVSDEVANASSSVEEMSVSNETVVRNTEKLATDVSDNLVMIHQLARSVEQVASAAASAGDASETAVARAREGGAAVGRAGDGVEELARTMVEIATVNRSLAGSSERINYVTEVIEEIAKKTKLLALNASLQATHAGEHGRAFRAVAVEVKALAERSSGSAKEIGNLIEEVQQAIKDAETISQLGAEKARDSVRLAAHAGGQLGQVVDVIQKVSENMLGISQAAREQSVSSDRLVANFERMRNMTEEVATATRQQRLGGQQMLEAMGRLRAIAERVTNILAEHGGDGQQVRKAMESVSEISSENLTTASELVEVAEHLERQAGELQALAKSLESRSPEAATQPSSEMSLSPQPG